MKKLSAAALACLLAVAAGCAAPPAEGESDGAYCVYYSALSDQQAFSSVDWEVHTLEQGAEPVPALVELLLEGPEDPQLTSPFPHGVQLLSWSLEEGRLHLDLSEQYGGLTGVDLTVADTCLALTLCQVEGVDRVYVTVEGSELPYRPIRQLREEDVLLSGSGEEPVYITVDLWYPRAGALELGVERRQLLTEEGALVQAVLTAWGEGPQEEGLLSCLPESGQVRSATVQDGICTVDLSAEFVSGLSPDRTQTRLAVYALVNTLGGLETVDGVRLLVEGQRVAHINGVAADQPLTPDLSLAPDADGSASGA